MRLRAGTTISLVIHEGDLTCAVVRFGAELSHPRPAVLCADTIEGFLELTSAQQRSKFESIRAIAGDRARVVLTVPSDWCAMHPIALTCAQWEGARDEIIRSVDRLLPLTPDDAGVGLLDLHGADSNPGDAPRSGMLVGAERSRLEPWTSAIASALDHPISSVRSAAMSALGLGLQHDERAVVVEPDGSAMTLRWGRVVSVGELLTEQGEAGSRTITLSNDPDDPAGGPGALAIASALADVVAPASFRPISGKASAPERRWAAPALCALLAIALLIFASYVGDRRYERATAAQTQRQRELADALDETQRLRLETERLTRLLNEGVAATINQWEAITPALIEAQAAIPPDGTLHRLDLDTSAIALRGEAGDAGAALTALEASDSFTDAAFTAPVSKSTDNTDLFELRADRDRRTSGGGAGE
ncbi:MAG: hypothetical protein H6813_05610 [Phycisphaeraceae bacterium]|nr:hypothetical protein [Phycisphaeraceae bacterium]MCB9847944.1 hypothetical protein [Phycisphaeraceae bacterium]